MFWAELIQRFVHFLDVGAGSRVLRMLMVGTMIAALGVWYDLHCFRNFSAPEAMDSAQLARNLAEGRGYVTDFVRPLSVSLVSQKNQAGAAGAAAGTNFDFARLREAHPDLANPPIYPLFLAGWMKVLPFHYAVEFKKSFWAEDGQFARYQPDFLITVINQLLLLVLVGQTFLIGRKLFDPELAWVSALLVLGCEQLWEFSRSGLSTLLVAVIFLGLVRVLMVIEEKARGPEPKVKPLFALAALAGLLVGAGTLTRYGFGGMMVPVVVFLVGFGGREWRRQSLIAAGAFLVVLAPWLLRNYWVGGTLFGTAGFTMAEGSRVHPGLLLERSLHPDWSAVWRIKPLFFKLLANLRLILQDDLPQLGRSWATLLFFAGLLIGFRSLPIRRLRYFLLMSLGVPAVAQALGRPQWSDALPVVNSGNLLVLALPLVLIYGTAFFITCLDQIEMPLLVTAQTLRRAAQAGFVVVLSLPLLGTLISRAPVPVTYPPYYPPDFQKLAGWMKKNELLMSDVPWAVAWYGHRQCLWLTLDTQDDFYAVNDNLKPVSALYLSPESLDVKMFSEGLRAPENSWDKFVFDTYVPAAVPPQSPAHHTFSSITIGGAEAEAVPPQFPLSHSPTGPAAIISGMFLADRVRWPADAPTPVTPRPVTPRPAAGGP